MKPIKVVTWPTATGRSAEGIKDLSVRRGADGALYSLWRPSIAERLRILRGKPVVVGVLSDRQPPITVVVGVENIPQEDHGK